VAIEGGLPAYLEWLADQVSKPETDRQVNT
jgi:hypothetical protein